MFKKIFTLILAIVLCTLVACGNNSSEQNSGKDTESKTGSDVAENIAEIDVSMIKEKSSDYLVIDEKILLKNLETVTLSKDNWNQYFGDFDYVEHIEEKNAFGEVETEYDKYYYGFGLKNEYIGALNGVAFKFDGKKEKERRLAADNEEPDEIDYDEDLGYKKYNVQYKEYKANDPVIKVLDKNGNLIEENEGESAENFLAEVEYERIAGTHYEEYECLDIVGEMKVIKISDKMKDELKNYRNGIWVDHGGFAEPVTQWLEKSFE